MTIPKLLKTIRSDTWWSEGCPASHAFFGRAMYGLVEQGKYFSPAALPLTILVYSNGFVDEETPESGKREAYAWIAERVRRDPAFLKRIRSQHERIRSRFLQQERSLFRSMEKDTNVQLADRYRATLETYIDHVRIGAGLECVDVFTDTVLPDLLRKALPRLSEQARIDLAITMVAPEQLSFLEKEERMLFDGAIILSGMKRPTRSLTAAKTESPALRRTLAKLVSVYFWIRNNYKTAFVLDEQYFFSRMQELKKKYALRHLERERLRIETKIVRLKRCKDALKRQYAIPSDLLRHFRILAFMGSWIDDRKALMTRANHSWESFCREVSSRTGLSLAQTKWYDPGEFTALLKRGQRVSATVTRQRAKRSVYLIERAGRGWRAKSRFLYGNDADAIIRAFREREQTGEIRGVVACAPVPRIRGTVQIVLDVAKTRFVAGNILVTTMTRPEFVPLLRNAKAIITDEGGLTCHAAIISRELGIPCVIGTKVAAKVLKDGDRVEVDATKGTVRKIS